MHGQGNYQDHRIHPAHGDGGDTDANTTITIDGPSASKPSYGPFPSDGRPFPTAIFLDSGGVINDNSARAPQWVRKLSYIMPRLFGGPSKHWGESNRRFSEKVFEVSYWNDFVARYHTFAEFDRAYHLLWLEMMSEFMDELLLQDRLTQWQKAGGVHPHHHDSTTTATTTTTSMTTTSAVAAKESTKATKTSSLHGKERKTIAPPTLSMAEEVFQVLRKAMSEGESQAPKDDEIEMITHVTLPESADERLALAKAINDFCVGLVKADFPGARDAILRMRTDQQLAVYTCSNEVSSDLHYTFQAIDLLTLPGKEDEPVFTKLYGPDLVDQMKNGTKYYARIFEDCKVDPFQSIVVDDKELMLSWAKPLGVTTVQINKKRSATPMLVDAKMPDGSIRKVPAVDFCLESLAQLPDLLDAWKASLDKNTN
ncbi:hypothetical protein BGW41_007830 [Actinomortierella wolfii]|nr:hypothetical protein BGW41_007830 [Actinomortierella wolfii]